MKTYGSPTLFALILLVSFVGIAFWWHQAEAQQPVIPAGTPPVTTIQLPGAAVVPPRMLVDFMTVDDPRTGLKSRRVTVVDPESRRICVYAVAIGGPNDGKVELLSVRHIHADLQIEVFNGVDPMPNQLEEMMKRSPAR